MSPVLIHPVSATTTPFLLNINLSGTLYAEKENVIVPFPFDIKVLFIPSSPPEKASFIEEHKESSLAGETLTETITGTGTLGLKLIDGVTFGVFVTEGVTLGVIETRGVTEGQI